MTNNSELLNLAISQYTNNLKAAARETLKSIQTQNLELSFQAEKYLTACQPNIPEKYAPYSWISIAIERLNKEIDDQDLIAVIPVLTALNTASHFDF